MSERYQLVAVYEDGAEQVIELNNNNTNNKSTLSFIDSGTAYMANEDKLKKYLLKNKKINNLNVTFAIKYTNNREARYLPLIYNNPELRALALNVSEEKAINSYARYLVDKIEFELCNSDFYQSILELNEEIISQINNGNYLNNYTLDKIRQFYESFGSLKSDYSYREQYKKELAKSLKSYKTLRTLHIFYNMYMKSKLNNQLIQANHDYDIPEQLKYQNYNEQEEFGEIVPEYLQKAYDQGGMDAVWALVDSEEVIVNGYKFK